MKIKNKKITQISSAQNGLKILKIIRLLTKKILQFKNYLFGLINYFIKSCFVLKKVYIVKHERKSA